jgi:hypothetical protein
MAAYVMTYDNLVADVIKYSERDDTGFVDQIPMLIGLAEQAIAAEIKTLWELNVVQTTLIPGPTGSIVTKPARWRKTISMKINGNPVTHRSQDYVAQFQSESDQGVPIYYADYDYDHWALGPIPDAAYPIEIIYYSRIQPLDATNQENLITREAPQALLFGTLLQAQGYLKSLDKLQMWQGFYDKAMAALKAENTSRNVDRNTAVMEP